MSVKRLVPLHAVALEQDPLTARLGDIYYNSVEEELKYYNGSTWEKVGGTISGLADHIHTYDGTIYSVSGIEVPTSGIIDGGGA